MCVCVCVQGRKTGETEDSRKYSDCSTLKTAKFSSNQKIRSE